VIERLFVPIERRMAITELPSVNLPGTPRAISRQQAWEVVRAASERTP
jgi:hypothetical protein